MAAATRKIVGLGSGY